MSLVVKMPEISQEIKPSQQCDQPCALFRIPRKEKKKTVGREDVEMHGKEINSEEKKREENFKTKKGKLELSVQKLKHIFYARPC